MAKVEPMGSHQYELALQEGENPQPQNVIPMVDIRGKWQEVAVDVLIAMCCLIPGIGFFFGCRLLCKYGSSWSQGKSRMELVMLAYLLGFKLVLAPLLMAQVIWEQIHAFSKGAVDLRTLVGTWQIHCLLNAISIGSSVAWLILESQRKQIEQSVCEHKKRSKQILKANERAAHVLYRLQGSFPEQFNQETHRKAGSVRLCSHSGCVLWGSTAVIPFLMFAVYLVGQFVLIIKLQCFRNEEHLTQQECEEARLTELQFGPLGTFEVPSFVNPMSLFVWLTVGIQICLTTLYWKKLMEGVLITTSVHMRMNYHELLLFTALTPSSKGLNSLWSAWNLATLQEIVQGSFRRKSRGPEEDEWKQQLLQKIQDDRIEEKTIALDTEGEKRDYDFVLDLGKPEDIEAWWLLRQYIQIDFMDELAGAQCCGVIIMMLVAAFFFVGVMDWLQNHQISCALVLVILLTCALLFSMFELFLACVDINTLWERDNQHTLLDASVASARRDDHKVTRLLESMRNKVAHSDARQELFGVEVTANLRNAWLLSLFTVFLSSMWEVGKRFMEEADLEKVEDDLRGMIVNFTSAANYRIAQLGG